MVLLETEEVTEIHSILTLFFIHIQYQKKWRKKSFWRKTLYEIKIKQKMKKHLQLIDRNYGDDFFIPVETIVTDRSFGKIRSKWLGTQGRFWRLYTFPLWLLTVQSLSHRVSKNGLYASRKTLLPGHSLLQSSSGNCLWKVIRTPSKCSFPRSHGPAELQEGSALSKQEQQLQLETRKAPFLIDFKFSPEDFSVNAGLILKYSKSISRTSKGFSTLFIASYKGDVISLWFLRC